MKIRKKKRRNIQQAARQLKFETWMTRAAIFCYLWNGIAKYCYMQNVGQVWDKALEVWDEVLEVWNKALEVWAKALEV
jgi:phosphatidylglycerophosphatase A